MRAQAGAGEGHQAMVGDGHAMGIAAEIAQQVVGAAEEEFQVHHPALSVERSQPMRQRFWA